VQLSANEQSTEYRGKVGASDTAPFSAPAAKGMPALVLMYHHIGSVPEGADTTRRFLTVSTVDFEQQLSWLVEHAYTPVTLADILSAVKGEKTLPEKAVAITFDDGYSDVFENAVPLLEKFKLKGSFAVITGFVGSSPDYATWDQIITAQQQGMEIVSHTYSHFDAKSPKYTPEYVADNLQRSKKEIYDHLGVDTKILIYPYGHYTAEEIKLAQDAGYEMALTVHYGLHLDPQKPFEVPRVRVSGGEPLSRFIEYATGVFAPTTLSAAKP
jgi:peptidoglycan/xylan/chitin deacetylase (PgdA/CDA1 family)